MYVMPDSTASVDALESAQSHFPHSLLDFRKRLEERSGGRSVRAFGDAG
jgi:hypothetical protein